MNTLDSAYNPARACDSADPDTFFPQASDTKAARRAQELCLDCPILLECALEAIPLVQARDMADCVIAAVHLPGETALRDKKARKRAVEQLAAVVAAASRQRERGAA
jgi:Transcription factor WhiB